MKDFYKVSWVLLALAGAVCFSSAQATDVVYQRKGNDDVIELSNIAEVDAGQVPVSVTTTTDKSATMTMQGTQARAAGAREVPDDEASASAVEACIEREIADGRTGEFCDKKKLAHSATGTTPISSPETPGNYFGGSTGGSSFGITPMTSSGTSSAAVNNTSGGSGSTVNAGTGTGTGASVGNESSNVPVTTASSGAASSPATSVGTGSTGTNGNTGTGTTAGTGTGSTTPTATAPTQESLSASLQQYRDLMLKEAAAANINDNHAVSRRYLMTNRSAYQTVIGVGP